MDFWHSARDGTEPMSTLHPAALERIWEARRIEVAAATRKRLTPLFLRQPTFGDVILGTARRGGQVGPL